MRVGFVGTQDMTLPPAEAVSLYRHAAADLAQQGYTIVTLPTAGAGQFAAEAALVRGGQVELLVPGALYTSAWLARIEAAHTKRVTTTLFDPEVHAAWVAADQVLNPGHKGAGDLDAAVLACLHGLVATTDGLFVLPSREDNGFLATPAIRTARALGKPLLVLTSAADRAKLTEMLG